MPAKPKPEAPDLAELRRLLEAATPGPWHHGHNPDGYDPIAYFFAAYDQGPKGRVYLTCIPAPGKDVNDEALFTAITGNGPTSEANAQLIAALVNAAPSLLSELETLRARVAELDAALDLAARRFGRMGFTVWAYETRSAAAAALGREPAETLCVKSANHLSDCEFRSITRAEMQLGAPRCLRRGEPGNEPQGAGSPQQPAERKKEEGSGVERAAELLGQRLREKGLKLASIGIGAKNTIMVYLESKRRNGMPREWMGFPVKYERVGKVRPAITPSEGGRRGE